VPGDQPVNARMMDPEAQRVFEFLLSGDVSSQDCAAVQDAIHRYVDLGVAGRRVDMLMPGVALHLETCPECRDQYETLVELARMESTGALPPVAELWPNVLPSPAAGRAAAAQAIVNATRPANVVPVPARAATTRPARPNARVRLRRHFASSGPGRIWVPALIGVVALGVAFGWWQTHQAPRVDGSLIDTIATADQVREAHTADGAWAKVFFGAHSRTALIFVGGLPEPGPDQTRIKCWLKGIDGSSRLAAVLRRESPGRSWWTVDARRPMQDIAAVALTWADDETGRPLVEIPLLASR
jgi:hypothetical protein